MASASSGAIVARLAVGGPQSTKPDPYAVPPELLARLTGKDPAAASESTKDVVSRIASGSKWDFRGRRLMKVFEDAHAVAWLDPEGWTDCVVLVTSRVLPGLTAATPDGLPADALAGAASGLQHVSRGVRLGAAELWGVDASDVGVSVTMNCGAAAGGYFPRPVFEVSPRRAGDNHLRSAQAALAMGSGKGSARSLRRRLADPEPLERVPIAAPAAQAAAVLLFATRAGTAGTSTVRIMQFDAGGRIRSLDNRCARGAGHQAKAPFDGPAMAAAHGARAGFSEACNHQWEMIPCDDGGARREAARVEATRAHAAKRAALAHETAGMSPDDRMAVLSSYGITAAEAARTEAGALPEGEDEHGKGARRNGSAPCGMGPPSMWPAPGADPMLVTLRNPKTGFEVVAEGKRHGFLMPGARLRLMRTSHGEASAKPLRMQVVPVRAASRHLAGGVHLRVPFLFEGEAGGGSLLQEHMEAAGAQVPLLRASAQSGVGEDLDQTTPEQLAGAEGAMSVTGDVRQRWLYVTAESMPPSSKSGSASSELALQPWAGEAFDGRGPRRAASSGGDPLAAQTFFLAPFSHPLHPLVVPEARAPAARTAVVDASMGVLESVWESESKAKGASAAPAPPPSSTTATGTLSPHQPIRAPPSALSRARKGPQPTNGTPMASSTARRVRIQGSSAEVRKAARREAAAML